MYCTKCKINWAKLHSQDDDIGDETYEYCPSCAKDHFLIETQPGERFLCCPFTGKITSADTGKELVREVKHLFLKSKKPFDVEEWKKKKEYDEEKEMERIEYYQKVFAEQGAEAAEKAYFETYK